MTARGIQLGVGLVLAVATIAVSASMIAAAGEVTYTRDIQPLMAQKCLKCHGPGSPTLDEFNRDKDGYKKKSKGPRMDSYASLMAFVNGSDAGAIMRRLDDGKASAAGKAGNMYVFLGSNAEERQKNLAQFKTWIGAWNLKRKAELTAEELKAVAAPE